MPTQSELIAIAKSLIRSDEFPGVDITGHDTRVLAGGSEHEFDVRGITLRGTLVVFEQPAGVVQSVRFTPYDIKL